ncbi:MAG: hypothetical protein C0467_03155 [Planctomycetaceae bacterium]|nr:hypothetical protein [Planctomycetaceae bacterium]
MQNSGSAVPFILGGVLFLGLTQSAWADGGTVRTSVRKGNWQITVFTSPTPLRAGIIDVSVLVQDAKTGQPDHNVRVRVWGESQAEPKRLVTERATQEAATNKLLVAAVFELPEPGWWSFRVEIDGDGESETVAFELEAGEPLPRWVSFAGWIAWPTVAILVFALHQFLVRRKTARSRS